MNAERLLLEYLRFADAPSAITRLRRFILDLAVRGKLVAQDASDEPASELLKRIAYEKARLVKLGRTSERKDIASTLQNNNPFLLPKSWCWVPATYPTLTISDVGKKIHTREVLGSGEFPVVDQGKMFVRGYCNDATKVIRVAKPIVVFGDHTRETKLVDFDFVIGADGVKLLQPVGLFEKYYFLALTWLPLDSRGYGRHFKLLKASRLPLPPIAEQHRIVAKVDELMALCDRLEAARMGREAARDRLAAASLAHLNTPDPETFQDDARFALNALPALTTRPDQIKQLRQTILNLAVRGKLIPQDPTDEPADKLLQQITEEVASLKLPASLPEPPPFSAPKGWVWTQLGRFVDHSEAGWSPKTEDFPRTGEAWGVLKVSAVSWDKFRASENKQVIRGTEPRLKCAVRRGDFLISRANTSELVARAVIVDDDPVNLMMSDKIIRLHLTNQIDHRFIWIVNNHADFARLHYLQRASGVSASMKNVSRDVILSLPFPLPPLAEQHRIVAKVDGLMALCDRLEASLTGTEATRSRLLDALLTEALTPASDPEPLVEEALLHDAV